MASKGNSKSTTLLDPNVDYSAPQHLAGLSVKERDFIGFMMADLTMSPTEAARKVGYRNPASHGSRLMNKPIINRILSAHQKNKEKDFKIESYEVLKMLYRALTLDPLDLFDVADDGASMTLKDLRKVPPNIRSLITEVKVRTKTTDEGAESYVTCRWVSKELALQLCMKHLGLLTEKVEITGSVDVNLVSQLRTAIEKKSSIIDGNVISRMADSDL